MKVLHLAKYDLHGGAARAAFRIHQGLRAHGVDSKMLVGKKLGQDPNVIGPASRLEKAWEKIVARFDPLPTRLLRTSEAGLHSPNWLGSCRIQKAYALEPDLIQLHWICAGYLRPEAIPSLPKKPLVWRLPDMWAFSGAEHYGPDLTSGEPLRYIEGYRSENRPKTEAGFDLNAWVWKRKMRAWQSLARLTIVTPSQWLKELASKSLLFKSRRIEVIPTGQDMVRFSPMDQALARMKLGLPLDKKLVLFGAISATGDRRKGFHLLKPALKHLVDSGRASDVEAVVFGASAPAQDPGLALKTHYLGSFSDDVSLSLVYAAADVFVAPSVQENLANTVIESMGCGTPVVAFKTGGMPEAILHQQTGYIAQAFDPADLASGIHWVLEEPSRLSALRAQARERALAEYSIETQAKRYLDLYRELLR